MNIFLCPVDLIKEKIQTFKTNKVNQSTYYTAVTYVELKMDEDTLTSGRDIYIIVFYLQFVS